MNIAEQDWHTLWNNFSAAMNYKLFEIDGNGISFAKLLSGVLLLVVGYLFSLRTSREMGKRVLNHMPVEPSVRYTFQQLIFYFLLFLTTLFTLRVLNVPITIFTVLGGALAVGIGFGSQNLVNNFISGLLVMAERPIRVGDYIEVDSISGQVENIGIRATVVRSGQNNVVIIPNTTFIQNNLINWTMSQTIQNSVRIGVDYNTDTDLFLRLCRQAMEEMPAILELPATDVQFIDFGDSALIFDLTYHIPAEKFPERKAVATALRFALLKSLAKNGVNIPFPVRDVRMRAEPQSPS